MLDKAFKVYTEYKKTDAEAMLAKVQSVVDSLKEPEGLEGYKELFMRVEETVEIVKDKVHLKYSIEELKAYLDAANQARETEYYTLVDEVNAKYEALIEKREAEYKQEAAEFNDEVRKRIASENGVYLAIEEKQRQLAEYSDIINDLCAAYSITTEDVSIDNNSFDVTTLYNLYEDSLEYLGKPGRARRNFIKQFREKCGDVLLQGTVLLVAIILMFTSVFDIVALVGLVYIIYHQVKAKSKVQLYATFLGLLYNIQPKDIGYKDVEASGELMSEELDEDNDEEVQRIAQDWESELASVEIEDFTDILQEVYKNLVSRTSEFESVFRQNEENFERDKTELLERLLGIQSSAKENFEEKKAKVSYLGTKISDSVVFNTQFTLGLKEGVIEEKIDVGLSNIIIKPYSDVEVFESFLQVLVANAMCNVKAGNITLHVYDPNNFGQALIGFYDAELSGNMRFYNDGLDKVVEELRVTAMENMKRLKSADITSYNMEAEAEGKVELEYNLLVVLSQPKKIEEDEALRSFMSYSAKLGVLVWLVTDKMLEGTYVFNKPFEGVQHPYTIDRNSFAPMVTNSLKEAKSKIKVKPLPWKDFVSTIVPEDQIWTYSGDSYIEFDLGYVNGDPSNHYNYTLGNTGDIHGLAAGATGAGKSACLNAIIATMCRKYSPEELELWLIDYKRVEFTFFLKSEERPFTFPQIKTCLCTTDGDYAESVYAALDKICQERFRLFGEYGVKNLKEYNELMVNRGMPEKRLSRIVFINDEFQVIFETAEDKAKDRIQKSLTSVAKLGRAAGVHLFFTSQSMNKTVSEDVLNQFSLKIALKCDDNLSRTLLGNTKSAQMKEPFGYCHVASKKDISQDVQKKFKIPYITTDNLIEAMKECWDRAAERGIPYHEMITYDEETKHSISELDALYDEVNLSNESTPDEGLFFLGNRMTYSTENKAPENIIINNDVNMHIMSVFDYVEDVVDFYQSILHNLKHFKKQPKIFINAQNKDLHYVCEVDKDMLGDSNFLSTEEFDAKSAISFFQMILEQRKTLEEINDSVYYILIGWDQAQGIGIDIDSMLIATFSSILKQASQVGMHFIFICQDVSKFSLNLIDACKIKICGACSEDSSYKLLNTKQGATQGSLKNGWLYVKNGNTIPKRAKLYLSEKERSIKPKEFKL